MYLPPAFIVIASSLAMSEAFLVSSGLVWWNLKRCARSLWRTELLLYILLFDNRSFTPFLGKMQIYVDREWKDVTSAESFKITKLEAQVGNFYCNCFFYVLKPFAHLHYKSNLQRTIPLFLVFDVALLRVSDSLRWWDSFLWRINCFSAHLVFSTSHIFIMLAAFSLWRHFKSFYQRWCFYLAFPWYHHHINLLRSFFPLHVHVACLIIISLSCSLLFMFCTCSAHF